jgi:hypothetical protein
VLGSELAESAINQLLSAGLVLFASRRDHHAVVAIRFQSIADPPAPVVFHFLADVFQGRS